MVIMICNGHNQIYCAVSFETTVFSDLKYFLAEENIALTRIDPEDFIQRKDFDNATSVINLVTRDFNLRKSVTEHIDLLNVQRFAYSHPSNVIQSTCSPGTVIYPFAVINSNTILGKDLIFFGHNGISHNCKIGTGSIIGTYTMLSGSSTIGEYCRVNSYSMIYDGVTLGNRIEISSHSIVRKDIKDSGIYVSVNQPIIKKLKSIDIS